MPAKTRFFLAAVTAALIFFAVVCGATEPTPGKIVGGKLSEHPSWFKESFLDIAEDVSEAAEANKHVILFLHLNGCPYCYKMTEENFKHAPYTEFIKAHFDVIALNIRGDREIALNEHTSLSEKELASKLRVVYTPTVIFLDRDSKVVARVNGYRSVEDFKHVLDYVYHEAYRETSLGAYVDKRKSAVYEFRPHPQLVTSSDLSALADRPLAVLFEDQGCGDCAALHDGHLRDPAVKDLLKNFSFVRLDALSSEPITDVAGNRTTARTYAESLDLTYRPGIVLFDRGKEIMRIESRLYDFHFQEILRYVGERHYERYPNSFYDYLDVKTATLLEAGQDVDIGESPDAAPSRRR